MSLQAYSWMKKGEQTLMILRQLNSANQSSKSFNVWRPRKQPFIKKVLDSKDHLFGAILIDLDLEDLNLEELDLHDVKMTKAKLIALWLKGVDLSQALNLTPDQI